MLKKKLRSSRGETLTEILAAILVCGFSIMLLVGMITTSMRINSSAREMDGVFYEALSDVETHTFAATDDPCAVKLSQSGPGSTLPTLSLPVRGYTQNGLTVYGEVSP